MMLKSLLLLCCLYILCEGLAVTGKHGYIHNPSLNELNLEFVLSFMKFLPIGGALPRTQRNTELSENTGEGENASTCSCSRDGRDGLAGRDGVAGRDGLPGRDGRDGKDEEIGAQGALGENGNPGIQGPQGPPGRSGGGVVYTRWGRTTCPDTPGTELVYEGRAAGSYYTHQGGGANYLCLPDDPDYDLAYTAGTQSNSPLYGTEFRRGSGGPLNDISPSYNDHNIPCAVCYAAARGAAIMLPAKTVCPSTWTLEYSGYLMAGRNTHHRSSFECLDKDPEPIPGSTIGIAMAYMFHVEATCTGIPCPPYNDYKELTCAVCTK